MLMKVCFVFAIIGCAMGALETPKPTIRCYTEGLDVAYNCTACSIEYDTNKGMYGESCIRTDDFKKGLTYDFQTGSATLICITQLCNVFIPNSCMTDNGGICDSMKGWQGCYIKEKEDGTYEHGCIQTVDRKTLGFKNNQFTCSLSAGPSFCNSIDAYVTAKTTIPCFLEGFSETNGCTACSVEYDSNKGMHGESCITTNDFNEGVTYDLQTGSVKIICTTRYCNTFIPYSCMMDNGGICDKEHGWKGCYVKEKEDGTYEHGCMTTLDWKTLGFKNNTFTCSLFVEPSFCNSINAYLEAKIESQDSVAGK